MGSNDVLGDDRCLQRFVKAKKRTTVKLSKAFTFKTLRAVSVGIATYLIVHRPGARAEWADSSFLEDEIALP